MPVINPSVVPTVAPGNLFTTLTQDDTLNVRWLTSVDPAFYEALNRPISDTVLRQLILAKTLDQLSVSIGHQAMYPFLVQAQVASGTETVDVPDGWIWDLHMSLPAKWENFRLAKIKRLSGENTTSGATGLLRLIITASQESSSIETAVFTADFDIDSALTYQRSRLTVATTVEETVAIDPGESETINGFITFRTLDQTDPIVEAFFDILSPGVNPTDADSDGIYDTPEEYEIVDTVPGGTGVVSDFQVASMSHGTGLLVDSSENTIPSLDSDVQSWINTFNYPFDSSANRTSSGTTAIVIPIGLFREFDITGPAGDEPTDDTTGTFFPVWISKIENITDSSGDQLRFTFATHNVSDDSPSLDAVDFARLDLAATMVSGEIVEIVPIDDLTLHVGSNDELFQQHFGRGHVVLSSVWDETTSVIDDFFDLFATIGVEEVDYTQSSTRISSFGVSRVSKYIPTIGQSQALVGTASDLDTPVAPSEDNKFVTEADQGQGNAIDLEADGDIDPQDGIDRYGYTGALAHRIVRLCVDGTKIPTDSETGASTFYVDEILPRLRLLLGRDPKFGDFWFDGTRLKFYNGDTWQG
jgi:hypothetical protein